MKALIYSLLAVFLLFSGCETKTFQYLTGMKRDLDFTVNETGAFEDSTTIFAADINDELDLPADAVIRNVFVESFSYSIEELEGNIATAAELDGYVRSAGSSSREEFVRDAPLSLAMTAGDYVKLAGLVSDGVVNIRETLEDFMLTGDPAFLVFIIEGDTDPNPGERIHVRIRIRVSFSVAYDVETEFLR